MLRRLSVAAMAVLATACTSVHSSDLETSGMSAHMTVTADGSGATGVSVELNVDDNFTDYVDLTDGDSLVATPSGGPSEALSRNDALGVISYSAGFTGKDAPGTSYTVAFQRQSPDVSAPASACTIPTPFTITSPPGGASFSRSSDAIAVTYGSSGTSDAMSYLVTGSCVNQASGPIAGDSGAFTVPRGVLVAAGMTGSCTAQLSIWRTRDGQLDPAYGYGGGIACDQVRSVTFTSNP